MKKAGIAIVLYVFILSNSVSAKDFGNRGTNYPVAEESILLMFQKKLGALDLKKEEERMRKVAEERIKNPAPVSGIVPAKETREFWHDPTYILRVSRAMALNRFQACTACIGLQEHRPVDIQVLRKTDGCNNVHSAWGTLPERNRLLHGYQPYSLVPDTTLLRVSNTRRLTHLIWIACAARWQGPKPIPGTES